jgi:hypothetical protein
MSQIRYTIGLNYISDNKEISIDNNAIQYIIIDHNYDNRNMPIIYINLNLESNMVNNMLKNVNKNTITLNIAVFDNDQKNTVKKDYIKDQFIYFIASQPNYDNLDDNINTSDNMDYKNITIGLLKIDLLNNNKMLINNVFSNTNTISIIHYYTKHMKMIIEPLEFDYVKSSFIIPPLESVSQLIRYLNNANALYSTQYRYFMDFNKTYILSTSGNPIDINDGTYSSIIINIDEDTPQINMIIDPKQKVYSLNVDVGNTNMNSNIISDKSYNYILGVTTDGITSQFDLDINKNSLSAKKPKIHRIANENLNGVKNLKNMYESSAAILNLSKPEIDSSIFTINKQYNINNSSIYSDFDGKFLLSYKKEVYKPEGDFFITNTILGFRKIIS